MQLLSNTYCDFAIQFFAVLWAELTHCRANEPQTLCLTQWVYKGSRKPRVEWWLLVFSSNLHNIYADAITVASCCNSYWNPVMRLFLLCVFRIILLASFCLRVPICERWTLVVFSYNTSQTLPNFVRSKCILYQSLVTTLQIIILMYFVKCGEI